MHESPIHPSQLTDGCEEGESAPLHSDVCLAHVKDNGAEHAYT